MAEFDMTEGSYLDDDHRATYIFDPSEDVVHGSGKKGHGRPSKRRKVAPKATDDIPDLTEAQYFEPLFGGSEKPEMVSRRQELFEESRELVDARIQKVLKEANQTTLDEVEAFVDTAPATTLKIPAALIITGPNVAAQDLLFGQLSEKLAGSNRGRFVRLRSPEAPSLKAALKKIIRDATAHPLAEGDDEDGDITMGHDGRKYLDYDLEALHTFGKPLDHNGVIIAFEDSEAFDSGLLSDLISLFNSWRDRIQFTLLFGVATSVELFQARLPKSTSQLLYGGQVDVVQATSVLDSIVKVGVASAEIGLRVGASLLRSLVDRQLHEVAGVQIFASSLKYAHMCHCYANPLSALLSAPDEALDDTPSEYLAALRSLPSFMKHVETLLDNGSDQRAKSLLKDDRYLIEALRDASQNQQAWVLRLLRGLHLITSIGLSPQSFSELYIAAMSNGLDAASESWGIVDGIKRLEPSEVTALCQRLLDAIENGNPELGLPGWTSEANKLVKTLTETQDTTRGLEAKAKESGNVLRSSYTAQSRVLRATVVAQKVQLSQDSAKLTPEDKEFTAVVDRLVEQVSKVIECESAEAILFHEIWLYESRAPYRDVFVPTPGTTIERALSRPHDYLGCACCAASKGDEEGVAATAPATCILYGLYLEAGSLVNVADLWTAFYGTVGSEDDEENGDSGDGIDERTALVLFYRALAELRALGFVKGSRKKADHVMKVRWL